MSERRRLRIVAGLVAFGASLWLATTAAAVDSPAANWAFNETSGSIAADAVGTLDGVIDGAMPVADGFDDGAFHFDGTSDVTIPGDPALRADDLTLSLWVRADPEAPPAAGQVIVDYGNALCGGNGYALIATSEHVSLVFRDAQPNVGTVTLTPAATLDFPGLWDGAWHHVAIGSHADQWGWVYLYIDGWHVSWTSNAVDSSDGIAFGASPTYPFVVGDDSNDCGPGFAGDIDEIRAYDELVLHTDLLAMEPVGETTLTIEEVEQPATVNIGGLNWFDIDVTLLPAPARPGSFWVYVTAEDGIERPIQRFDIELWELSADGHYDLAFNSDYGGTSTIRVEFEAMLPAWSAEDTEVIEIAKAPTESHVQFQAIDIAGESLTIGASAHTPGNAPVTGTIELWEVTGTPTLIGTAAVQPGFSGVGGAAFELPGRPAGEYIFEAHYLGGPAQQPSDSVPATLTVLPALETGEVSINGGAATTDDPIVEVSAPATGAIAMLITTDPNDLRRQFDIPYSETFTTWLTAPWFGDDADGVRTIWVKWADAKSRWTDWSTDTIVLDRPPAGTTTIDGGAGYTTDTLVDVAVPIAEPESVDAVELSNDGESWTTFDYDESIAWTLTPGAGAKSVRARWIDTEGKASMSVGDSIVLDSVAPTATGPTYAFPAGSNVDRGKVPVQLAWTGADATSGIDRYQLARSKDGGAYRPVSASLAAATSLRMLEPGHTYRFRVRPIDKAGNVGAWAYGASFRIAAVQEWSGRIDYDGAWKTATSRAHWGGTSRFSKNGGARASITVNARSFAWVASLGPSRGTARVYVNGNLVATVDLQSASAATREVVFAKTWASARSRTIEIRVSGTNGHPRVDVDALAWGT